MATREVMENTKTEWETVCKRSAAIYYSNNRAPTDNK